MFPCTLSIINCNVDAAIRASFEYTLFDAQMRCELSKASSNLPNCGGPVFPPFPAAGNDRMSTDNSRQITIDASKKSCAVNEETIHRSSYSRPCRLEVAACKSVCLDRTSSAALIHALRLNSRCESWRSVFR